MSAPMDKLAETTKVATADPESLLERRPARRRPFLLVYHKDRVDTVHLSEDASVVVGREAPADIVIPDGSLSRRHARFSVQGGKVVVEDLGSTNGTRIGHRRITREILRPGDAVTLGAVTIAAHVLPGASPLFLSLDDHDSLRAALEAEIDRARFFGRSLALVTVRSRDPREGHVLRWSPRVQSLLRPVDRIGLYSNDTVEILLPEMTQEQAVSFAETALRGAEGEPPLGAGIACFPGAAGSADALLEESRHAALSATVDTPVRVAPSDRARAWTPAPEEEGGVGLVARSPKLRAVVELARRAARAVVPVLLQGETGTGKEVLARLIHEAGPRAGRPMICVNCGAIPAQLVESTLFGHERGAFTGAVQQQKGVFEAADGGSVFLDEVGELPAVAQAALLRVLETKRITRVGSTREVEVDARIIAATHRDLEAMVAAGSFREDLYYRLCVMTLDIPPLRERREDIPLLVARFVQQAAAANGSVVRAIHPDAVAVLERHSWPGNVRELRNVIERATVIAEGDTITVNELSERLRAAAGSPGATARGVTQMPGPEPAPGRGPDPSARDAEERLQGSLREQMDRFEAGLLMRALRAAGDSQAEAARLLDVPLRTLQHRLKAHGIRKGGYAGPSSDG